MADSNLQGVISAGYNDNSQWQQASASRSVGEEYASEIAAAFCDKPELRILELGAGTGRASAVFLDALLSDPRMHKTKVVLRQTDFTQDALPTLSANAAALVNKYPNRLEVSVGEGNFIKPDPTGATQTYDLTLCLMALHWLADEDAYTPSEYPGYIRPNHALFSGIPSTPVEISRKMDKIWYAQLDQILQARVLDTTLQGSFVFTIPVVNSIMSPLPEEHPLMLMTKIVNYDARLSLERPIDCLVFPYAIPRVEDLTLHLSTHPHVEKCDVYLAVVQHPLAIDCAKLYNKDVAVQSKQYKALRTTAVNQVVAGLRAVYTKPLIKRFINAQIPGFFAEGTPESNAITFADGLFLSVEERLLSEQSIEATNGKLHTGFPVATVTIKLKDRSDTTSD